MMSSVSGAGGMLIGTEPEARMTFSAHLLLVLVLAVWGLRDCSVFALDARRVIRSKLAALPRNAPLRCGSLAHVACDLTDPAWADALAAAPGYRSDVPTFYVAEGLLYYLDEADVSQIVEAIARTAPPRSRFLSSLISTGALSNAKKRGTRVFSAFRFPASN